MYETVDHTPYSIKTIDKSRILMGLNKKIKIKNCTHRDRFHCGTQLKSMLQHLTPIGQIAIAIKYANKICDETEDCRNLSLVSADAAILMGSNDVPYEHLLDEKLVTTPSVDSKIQETCNSNVNSFIAPDIIDSGQQ